MNKIPTPARVLRLRPGESRPLRLPVGSQLLLREGRLQLDGPPDWLAERLHRPSHRLEAGVAHRIDTRGWLRLSAGDSPAEVLVMVPTPASPWQRLRGLFRFRARGLDHLRPLA